MKLIGFLVLLFLSHQIAGMTLPLNQFLRKNPTNIQNHLVRVCAEGTLSEFLALIKKGASYDSSNDFGTLPLHWAIIHGNLPIIEWFLNHARSKELFNQTDKYGNTALSTIQNHFQAKSHFSNGSLVQILKATGALEPSRN